MWICGNSSVRSHVVFQRNLLLFQRENERQLVPHTASTSTRVSSISPTVTASVGSQEPEEESDCLFRIGILALPSSFNIDLPNHSLEYWDLNHGYGRHQAGNFWSTAHDYVLDLVVFSQIMDSPCATHDLSLSDLVYVPYWYSQLSMKWNNKWVGPRTTKWMISALDVSKAARAKMDFRLLQILADSDISGKTLIGVNAFVEDVSPDFGPNNFVELSFETVHWFNVSRPGFAIPYFTHLHYDTNVSVDGRRSCGQPPYPRAIRFECSDNYTDHKRNGKIFMGFNAERGFAKYGYDKVDISRNLRQSLIDQCEKFNHCVTESVAKLSSGKITEVNKNMMHLQLSMAKFTFCVQPSGDTISRKAFWDSLLFGCIPVVFFEEQISQYEFFLPEIRDVAILVPENRHNSTVEYLKHIFSDDRRWVNWVLVKISSRGFRRSITYSHIPVVTKNCTSDHTCDATETILFRLHENTKTNS